MKKIYALAIVAQKDTRVSVTAATALARSREEAIGIAISRVGKLKYPVKDGWINRKCAVIAAPQPFPTGESSAAEKDARIAKLTESLKYAHLQLSVVREENASLLTTLYTERSKVDMLHGEIRRQHIAHSDALATLNSKLEEDNG